MATTSETKHRVATLEEILATRVKKDFAYRINFDKIGYESIKLMKTWCEENCQGRWHSETIHALYFQFELERDAFIFKLKWASAEGNKLR